MEAAKITPFQGMCFQLVANGIPMGSYSECSGLVIDVTTEDLKEGGNNHFVYKLPQHIATPPLVLKKGLTSGRDLWNWIRTYVEQSVVTPKDLQIFLMTPGLTGRPVRSWVVVRAYPTKWDGPTLNAMNGDVVFETVELAHQGISAGVSTGI